MQEILKYWYRPRVRWNKMCAAAGVLCSALYTCKQRTQQALQAPQFSFLRYLLFFILFSSLVMMVITLCTLEFYSSQRTIPCSISFKECSFLWAQLAAVPGGSSWEIGNWHLEIIASCIFTSLNCLNNPARLGLPLPFLDRKRGFCRIGWLALGHAAGNSGVWIQIQAGMAAKSHLHVGVRGE